MLNVFSQWIMNRVFSHCYKTFYVRNLQMFALSQSVCLSQAFSAQFNIFGKARSLPSSGAPERSFIRVGSDFDFKLQTRLERPARDKHSNLLQTFVNDGCKKLNNIGPWTTSQERLTFDDILNVEFTLSSVHFRERAAP